MIRGIDVSAYQINVPWRSLMDNGGLCFAIIKGDQLVATDNHIALAREAKVPIVGEYFWNDPTSSAQYQIDSFAKDIEKHDPDFIWIDVEQYWGYWQDYWDYLNKKITADQIRKKSPQAISDNAYFVANGLRHYFPKKVVGIYSATWFVWNYAKPMLGWLGDFPLWWAHYFDGGLGVRNVTWAYLKTTPPENFTVWMPPNSGLKWQIWQYSSTMITPAQNARYDWNAYNGTLEQMTDEFSLKMSDHEILMKLWQAHPELWPLH